MEAASLNIIFLCQLEYISPCLTHFLSSLPLFLCVALKKKKKTPQDCSFITQTHQANAAKPKGICNRPKATLYRMVKAGGSQRFCSDDSSRVSTAARECWAIKFMYLENRLVLKQELLLGSDRSSESASLREGKLVAVSKDAINILVYTKTKV